MKRYILTGTAILAVVLAVVFVFNHSSADDPEQHGFYGYVTYSNCDCSDGAYPDRVFIQELPSGTPDGYYLVCRNNQGWYDTEIMAEKTYPPGDYKIWLDLWDDSDCETGTIQQVYHQYATQQVDLTAYGPGGGGS